MMRWSTCFPDKSWCFLQPLDKGCCPIILDIAAYFALSLAYHRFIPEAWSACSVTCGVGSQVRPVKCQVLLSFSQSVADLPIDECEGPKPASQRACYSGPCSGEAAESNPEETELIYGGLQDFDELYDWEYEGFTECSESCGGGEGNLLFALVNLLSPFPVYGALQCALSKRRLCYICLKNKKGFNGKLLRINYMYFPFGPIEYQMPCSCSQLWMINAANTAVYISFLMTYIFYSHKEE